MSDEIALAEYDPAWPTLYRIARDEVLVCLPVAPRLIEHIGSTAVPGLAAKPVIDIIVLVEDMVSAQLALPALERAGYEFRPEVSNQSRFFLRRKRPEDGRRTHHLHLHGDEGDVRRHLLFRDSLRADENVRSQYVALKRDLAARFVDNREAYAKGKDAFVDRIVAAAGGPPRKPFWKPEESAPGT